MSPAQLTDARVALHLSQAELARTLGVAANTVNRWEAGVRTIPPYLRLAMLGIHLRAVLAKGQTMIDSLDDEGEFDVDAVHAFAAALNEHSPVA